MTAQQEKFNFDLSQGKLGNYPIFQHTLHGHVVPDDLHQEVKYVNYKLPTRPNGEFIYWEYHQWFLLPWNSYYVVGAELRNFRPLKTSKDKLIYNDIRFNCVLGDQVIQLHANHNNEAWYWAIDAIAEQGFFASKRTKLDMKITIWVNNSKVPKAIHDGFEQPTSFDEINDLDNGVWELVYATSKD